MNTFDLDHPIVQLGKENPTPWTIRNSIEGLQIFGGIGSGKTSGSGRFFALKYLSLGYGGLVLTAKPDEKDEWIKYCKEANREDDLIIVEPRGKHAFNFLAYESENLKGQFYTENILQVLKTVIRAGEEKKSGKSDDAFWETALDMLITSTLDLCMLAYKKVTVEDLYYIVRAVSVHGTDPITKYEDEVVDSAYTKAIKIADKNVRLIIDEKKIELSNSIPFDELIRMTEEEFNELLKPLTNELRAFINLQEFFVETYSVLSEKTKTIIEFYFTGFLFNLLREPVFSVFCSKESTFTPDDCLKGKIIIIDFPVKQYHKVGRDIQIMFKYVWQRAMEKRDVSENGRPVFLWADEAQNFLHEYDAEYQATARSSRIATVYISQNLPNYFANMGGGKFEYKVKSFLGTLATKIFHANADTETNEYASTLIGSTFREDWSKSTNTTNGKISITESVSYKLDREVRPEEFQTLLTGSKHNNHQVTAYVHIQGMRLINDMSYTRMKFNQEYKLK